MKKTEIVYANNHLLGYFKENVYKNYTNEEKNNLFLKIKNEIISKDFKRKLCSAISGISVLLITIILSLLMIFKVISLGESQWFIYIFLIALMVFIWLVIYYLLGFIFYKALKIDIYFKSSKTTNPNSCVTYASSNYSKWVNMLSEDANNFSLYKENKKKNDYVGFGLKMPSWKKNPLFNGHILCNIPYFYITYKGIKLLFLPGMIIYINGKNSDVFATEELSFKHENNQYFLYKKDQLLLDFQVTGTFNINFFYFHYEQI